MSHLDAASERIRFLSRGMGIVFLLVWVSWFWPFDDLLDRQGTPLGADFSMFYVAGQVVTDGQLEQLYDQSEHQGRLQELFPNLSPTFCLPYRYPPIVAWGMARLSSFSYPTAWILFTTLSIACFCLTFWLLIRGKLNTAVPLQTVRCLDWRMTAAWACLGWPVALEVFIGGQASMFALAIAVVSTMFLFRHQHLLAGMVLALSAYKPNVLAIFAIGVAIRYPRVLLGALVAGAAILGMNYLVSGKALAEYVQLTLNLASRSWDVETPFWKSHCLLPWLDWIAPGCGRTWSIVLGIVAAAGLAIWWRWAEGRFRNAAPLAISGLFVVNALLNPYTPVYDLVLLAVPAWLLADIWLAEKRHSATDSVIAQIGLASLFFGPHLSQALAKPLGFQLFPLGLLFGGIAWMAFCSRRATASARLERQMGPNLG